EIVCEGVSGGNRQVAGFEVGSKASIVCVGSEDGCEWEPVGQGIEEIGTHKRTLGFLDDETASRRCDAFIRGRTHGGGGAALRIVPWLVDHVGFTVVIHLHRLSIDGGI